jgi:glycosyltransferase involved in cell wall biosynthesis
VNQRIRELGLGSDVSLLGARSDVPSLLGLADLYVHYAKVESLGIALLEAARAGLPVAAVPAGGVSEVLDGLGSTLILTAHDVATSATVLCSVARDPDRLRQMGQRARQGFETSFTQEAMANSYLAILTRHGQ